MNKIVCYTDGSACVHYPKLGGFGVYIKTPEKNIKIRKGYCNTKTGRMEIMAALNCMRAIQNKQAELIIYSDSQYVCNTVNIWIDNWKVISYRDKANRDLLELLHTEIHKFKIRPKLRHIKGHQDISCEHTLGNNIADAEANYKTQESYEMDQPIALLELNNIELEDFEEIEGKTYYKKITI